MVYQVYGEVSDALVWIISRKALLNQSLVPFPEVSYNTSVHLLVLFGTWNNLEGSYFLVLSSGGHTQEMIHAQN